MPDAAPPSYVEQDGSDLHLILGTTRQGVRLLQRGFRNNPRVFVADGSAP
jgi:hypothetical protein